MPLPRQLFLLAAGLAGGALFAAAGMPVPWLTGSLAASLALALTQGRAWPLPPWWLRLAQVVLGLGVGVSFPASTWGILARHWLPVSFAILATAALSMANGHLLHRWAGVDPATGFLGSVPGGASAMVAASGELGADARIVAVLQYLRVLLVTVLAPPLVAWLHPAHGVSLAAPLATAPSTAWPATAPQLPALLVVGAAGAWLGQRLHLPAPAFLGPVALATLFHQLGWLSGPVPGWLMTAALVIVGASVGAQFDVGLVGRLKRMVAVEAALVLALMLAAAALGYLLHLLTGLDIPTALLGTAPGGMDAMVAQAVGLGAQPAVVASMHLSRLLFLLMAGPSLAQRLARRPRPASASGAPAGRAAPPTSPGAPRSTTF